jgi:ferrochelatase
MTNLGGPASLDEVEPFLRRLFADREIIPLPWQDRLGPFIAARRAPKTRARYAAIGGGSPILEWTRQQGEGLASLLDKISPATQPHKAYIAFRYAPPFVEDALRQMQADGVRRAVAFSQYPQFSCATTGSSLNELWRCVRGLGLESEFRWSLIDRWGTHPGFIQAMARSVLAGLQLVPEDARADTLILFSAHSLPLSVTRRGDSYPEEVTASVEAVMQCLGHSHPYRLSYQSAVGPVKWLSPRTDEVLRQSGAQKQRAVLVVPISFTSDHIETLEELDIEGREIAEKAGVRYYRRAPALNAEPGFVAGLADLVAQHLASGEACSPQYRQPCPGCPNPECRTILNPVK